MDIRRNLFTVRTMKHCNRLPREVMSLETFEARLDQAEQLHRAVGIPVNFRGVGLDDL